MKIKIELPNVDSMLKQGKDIIMDKLQKEGAGTTPPTTWIYQGNPWGARPTQIVDYILSRMEENLVATDQAGVIVNLRITVDQVRSIRVEMGQVKDGEVPERLAAAMKNHPPCILKGILEVLPQVCGDTRAGPEYVWGLYVQALKL